MTTTRRTLLAAGAAAAVAPFPRTGRAQARPVLTIGVMNDQSGPYRDATGMGSVVCAQQAAKEFNNAGFDVRIISADHQNKPDVGASIVRQWFDRDGVDVVLDVPTSSVALAVNQIAKERNKLYLNTGAGTGDLTGEQCTPVTIHWGYDTYMLAKSTATQLAKLGGTKWYMITADYVFGQQLSRDAMRFAKEGGATVLGESRYPFPTTTDFSSFLVAAQSSGANVIGLGNAGTDTSNCVKQAYEFGLTKTMKIAALLQEISDVKAIGTEIGQGLYLSSTFYWDQTEGTRAFTASVQDRMPNRQPPNMIQAACYGSVLHYLKVAAAMGVDKARDGAAACAAMKATPIEDGVYGKASIRKDGMAMIPSWLYQVKTPAESKGTWDLQKVVATTSAEDSWKPLKEEGCALAPG